MPDPAGAAEAAATAATADPATRPGTTDPASAPGAPLLRPGPGLRLLATALLAAIIGAVTGGAGAWAIYQHYGPVERIVNEEINGSPSSAGQTVGQLSQARSGSVVVIATQPVTSGDLAGGTASLVDGVVVGSDGLILTSAHAVEGASQLRVGLPDGSGFDAVIDQIDAAHGLALLRITGVTGLTPIALAAAAPAVGDQAIVLSRPASGGLGVDVGDVSAVGLTVTTDSTTGSTVQDTISIGATPEPGADGAPLLDSAGDLIGIVVTVTQAPSPPGITALSLTAARALVASASGGTAPAAGSFGAVSSYLDPARAAASHTTPGALIVSVEAGGPAAIAGLQKGDVVVSADGIAINATHTFDPVSLGLSPGDTVQITVVRGATTLTPDITVGPSG